MARVAVIGGGITGLVSALHLSDRGIDCVIFEASERLGGKVHTIPIGHEHIEEGPDALLPRDLGPIRLLERIGLADRLVSPAVFGAVVRWGTRLHDLPPGTVMGVPASVRAVREAGMLSPLGKVRAAAGVLRRSPLQGPDVSVASYVRSRFGRQVLERMVDPLLAGTRAGDPDDLSLAAAARDLDRRARGDVTPQVEPRFVSPRGGMSQIVTALTRALVDAEIRLSSPVAALETHGDVVHVDDEPFDAVVVTAPAHASARLLSSVAPGAASCLKRIHHASAATVNLAFSRGGIGLPERGSGLLVPSSQSGVVSAATWYTRKWPHTRPRDGSEIVRCFVGRAGREPALELDDRTLVDHVVDDLGRHVRIDATPRVLAIKRWDRGLPQYRVGHLSLVDEIRRGLPPAIAIAGADLEGTGIPDCIKQAEEATEAIASHLRR